MNAQNNRRTAFNFSSLFYALSAIALIVAFLYYNTLLINFFQHKKLRIIPSNATESSTNYFNPNKTWNTKITNRPEEVMLFNSNNKSEDLTESNLSQFSSLFKNFEKSINQKFEEMSRKNQQISGKIEENSEDIRKNSDRIKEISEKIDKISKDIRKNSHVIKEISKTIQNINKRIDSIEDILMKTSLFNKALDNQVIYYSINSTGNAVLLKHPKFGLVVEINQHVIYDETK